jgi:hypothetical protein
MTKLTSLLTASLLLPLVAFGSGDSENAPAMIQSDRAEFMAEVEGTSPYQCCWIYHMGRWYCIPC